jgi:hypothetical protein
LDLFTKQIRVKGDGRKYGHGKDGMIRITFQNIFTGIAEFGQEKDVVRGRLRGCQSGSMQEGKVRQYLGEQMEGRDQIKTEPAGSEMCDCTAPQNAKNVARIYRQAPS